MKKAFCFRFDHNNKTLEAGDLPVLAHGEVGHREVLLLRNNSDFFVQSRSEWGEVSVEPVSREGAEFSFSKLPNKQFDFGKAFGAKQPVHDRYIPGTVR